MLCLAFRSADSQEQPFPGRLADISPAVFLKQGEPFEKSQPETSVGISVQDTDPSLTRRVVI